MPGPSRAAPSSDAPRPRSRGAPLSGTPGRNESTTDEIDYQHVFAHLYEKGYDGLVGMEHGMSGEGTAGEQAVIDAYVSVDSFETANS